MEFANKDGARIKATPHQTATCPCCHADVISKCGELKRWHWSHINLSDCDTFAEPETMWHRSWKARFVEPCQEVVMGPHRSDIKTTLSGHGVFPDNEIVIEFQNSPLSVKDVLERESFYGRMVWVVNAAEFKDHFRHSQNNRVRWKWSHTHWTHAKCPVYLDMGSGLYLIERFINGGKLFEYSFVEYDTFLSMFNGVITPTDFGFDTIDHYNSIASQINAPMGVHNLKQIWIDADTTHPPYVQLYRGRFTICDGDNDGYDTTIDDGDDKKVSGHFNCQWDAVMHIEQLLSTPEGILLLTGTPEQQRQDAEKRRLAEEFMRRIREQHFLKWKPTYKGNESSEFCGFRVVVKQLNFGKYTFSTLYGGEWHMSRLLFATAAECKEYVRQMAVRFYNKQKAA